MKLRCYAEEFMLSVRRSRAKGLDILVQYCAKRMQTNFVEIRLLFPRNIVEILSEES